MKGGLNNMALKTFSFLDFGNKDLLKIDGKVVKVKAESRHHAEVLFIKSGEINKCENWTNTGTATYCWEEMRESVFG